MDSVSTLSQCLPTYLQVFFIITGIIIFYPSDNCFIWQNIKTGKHVGSECLKKHLSKMTSIIDSLFLYQTEEILLGWYKERKYLT